MSKWLLGTTMLGVLLCALSAVRRQRLALFITFDGLMLGDSKRKSSAVVPDLAKSNSKSSNKYQSGGSQFTPASQPQPEPSMWAKTTEAVSGSAKAVAASFQRGTQKAVDAFSKKEGEYVDDPIALSNSPREPNATFHVAVARVHERSNRMAQAGTEYQKALKLDKKHLAATLGYARVLDVQGETAEAEKLYLKATSDHPQEPSAFNDLGLFYGRQQRFEEARAALAKAVALQPERKLYRNNIATVLVYLKQPEEAFKNLVAVHPPDVAYYNVAFLLVQQNDYPRAMQHLELALVANPEMEEARQYRALLVAQMGAYGAPVAVQRGRPHSSPGPAVHAPVSEPHGPSLPSSAAMPHSAWPQQQQFQTAALPPQPTSPPQASGNALTPPGGYAPPAAYPPSRY